ncbi:MAG: glutamate racemase [Eubacterium sp.]|nr:glutamate racemase [Eubacterium sp.]
MSNQKDLPIGFMDSGLGGLSVMREALKLMPNEDFIYYGDSANAPYGTKDPDLIRDLTFRVVDQLLEEGIKGLAIACNTATSAAVRYLRQMYPDLPLVGIEPAIKPAVESSHGGEILVMATPMTIQQDKFQKLLAIYRQDARILPVPCAGLMEFVEKGDLDGEFLDAYFKEHLSPYLSKDTETVVLGCTHYPFLKPHLQEFLGPDIRLIDGSYGTSKELKRRLEEKDLLHQEERERTITIKNSLPNPEMIERSYKLLNM